MNELRIACDRLGEDAASVRLDRLVSACYYMRCCGFNTRASSTSHNRLKEKRTDTRHKLMRIDIANEYK